VNRTEEDEPGMGIERCRISVTAKLSRARHSLHEPFGGGL
jgi:hypothetical protein